MSTGLVGSGSPVVNLAEGGVEALRAWEQALPSGKDSLLPVRTYLAQ